MKHFSLLAALAALAACGGRPPSGMVAVHDGWARETTAGVIVSAGYGRIENGTGQDVRMTGADTPVAGRVEIHNVTDDDGVMRMRPLPEGIDIPAGETVELRPGSYHLMLLDLNRPLRGGERIPVTFRFGTGAPVTASFEVRNAAQAAQGGGQ
ncbi:copper chaperone PCu(A)C [Sphingosinicella sp. LHD-64]|uniref:copper chaperone PCu(A)C n=1 Tax=Sphingosinicella sp. LHD-64 TaxID=3072139 RepID=UPI00280F402D|nr:copper chaperone PCu(A)C [Sphingosinicella sp. LHD-64]MDQ8755636.1 copper chaperone PCu(A)C [Sphingosinicella sp. LHD-64]